VFQKEIEDLKAQLAKANADLKAAADAAAAAAAAAGNAAGAEAAAAAAATAAAAAAAAAAAEIAGLKDQLGKAQAEIADLKAKLEAALVPFSLCNFALSLNSQLLFQTFRLNDRMIENTCLCRAVFLLQTTQNLLWICRRRTES